MTYKFDAVAARSETEQALSIQGEFAREETQKVLEQIKSAAQRGQSSLATTRLGSDHTISGLIAGRLKNLGFIVEYASDQRDGGGYTIKW